MHAEITSLLFRTPGSIRFWGLHLLLLFSPVFYTRRAFSVVLPKKILLGIFSILLEIVTVDGTLPETRAYAWSISLILIDLNYLNVVFILVKVLYFAFAGVFKKWLPVPDVCSINDKLNRCYFASGKIRLDYYDSQVCTCMYRRGSKGGLGGPLVLFKIFITENTISMLRHFQVYFILCISKFSGSLRSPVI